MDCNKEEAIKARGIAEGIMGNGDFVGAKKFASKAQKLFPDLENITHMVSVCEVHCSAENKTFGNEKDWYDILKVEPTADDALIKKQYRKFALLLHPDKNKFPGAADAFTLIGEAQSVLLDRQKRILYNSRCLASGGFQVPMPRKSCQPDTRTHPWAQGTQSDTGNAYGKMNPEDLSGEYKKKNTKRKKTSTESSENCDSEEESKGGGYPSPNKESEVQHLSHEATPKGEEKKLEDSLFRVPSVKRTGMERNDVPEGSFELDPASLRTNQVGASAENCVASKLNQVPEPEFYRFAAERSQEKFQIGQCWAIYSDEDGLPRYYGQIKKIDHLPVFVLHVAWFYACPLPKSTVQWHDKTMPIGCGLFKFRNSKLNKYTVTNNFSHVVVAEPLKKGVYKIFPRTGEVWALYKNWSAQLKGNELEDFEYEIVEIVDVSDRYVDVKFLEWVKGFKSVYKPLAEEKEEVQGVVNISVSEHLMFSHRIPAFRLTEERGGSLRGFWELDPAAMPLYLLCTD